MSEQEMTYNQALQELTRFGNVWQATVMLKEALQLAAAAENDVKRLREDEQALKDINRRALEAVDAARLKSQEEIAEAKLASRDRIGELRLLAEKREQEYADSLARKEREVNNTIAHLERLLEKRREEIIGTTAALNKEIAIKQTLVRELDEQLSNLRRRLE